jgi:hypothetical protein
VKNAPLFERDATDMKKPRLRERAGLVGGTSEIKAPAQPNEGVRGFVGSPCHEEVR